MMNTTQTDMRHDGTGEPSLNVDNGTPDAHHAIACIIEQNATTEEWPVSAQFILRTSRADRRLLITYYTSIYPNNLNFPSRTPETAWLNMLVLRSSLTPPPSVEFAGTSVHVFKWYRVVVYCVSDTMIGLISCRVVFSLVSSRLSVI
jgi:hypothetical protein